MSAPEPPAGLPDEVARLEAVARLLEAEGLTPEQLRDLADEALAIAQRVSVLLADVRGGRAAAGDAGPPEPPSPPGA
jgi:hypothetical protein